MSERSPFALKLKSLGMNDGDLDAIVRVMKHRPLVAAGNDIVRSGDIAKHSTVLLEGMACAYKMSDGGGRSILSFQHAGDFCDLHRYALRDRDSAGGVQALTDCSIAIIDYRDMDPLLARPQVALAFWRATMLEAAIYRERLANAGRALALEQVASVLCEQLARREAVGIDGARLPISQVELADATGLSIVHVNRTVQILRGLNVLSKASHLEVTDRKRLAQIAKFDGRYLNMPMLLSTWAVKVEDSPA
jgi:CRP-like cAMP-binding protein